MGQIRTAKASNLTQNDGLRLDKVTSNKKRMKPSVLISFIVTVTVLQCITMWSYNTMQHGQGQQHVQPEKHLGGTDASKPLVSSPISADKEAVLYSFVPKPGMASTQEEGKKQIDSLSHHSLLSSSAANWYCSWNSSMSIKTPSNIHVTSSASSSNKYYENDCYSLFSKYTLQEKQHWIFLGDSNMNLLYQHLIQSLNDTALHRNGERHNHTQREHKPDHKLKQLKFESHNNTDRCVRNISKLTSYMDEYLDGPPPQHNVWIKPNYAYGEGPAAPHYMSFDSQKPFLCHNLPAPYQKVQLELLQRQPDQRQSKTIEFIVSAFARDVEVPSLTTKTTQETISLYLQRSYEARPSTNSGTSSSSSHSSSGLVCVVNSGLHDMYIPGSNHRRHYIRNVKWYIYDLLLGRAHCSVVVWITISATMDQKKYKQRNYKVSSWNQAIINMIQNQTASRMNEESREGVNTSFGGIVLVLDVYNESHKTQHVDNAHLIDEYYQKLNTYLFERFLLDY